jgi:flavin reductase (DIM6/NTAB) family NADH-FMN oxidoreductase RutF
MRFEKPALSGKFLSLDPHDLGQAGMYKLLIGGVLPRPIAWVSTIDPNGCANLAPFSFFNAVSSHPPCLSISIARKPDGSKKDTLLNIEATRQFVVNLAPSWLADAMNQTSAEYPLGVSEFEKAGLTPAPSSRVRAPRIAESPLSFECELYETLEIGDGSLGSATLIIGRIVNIQVDASAIQDEKLVFEKLDPLSRLGGLHYGLTRERFELPRPKALS